MKQAIDIQEFKIRDAASYDSVTEQFDHFTERLSSPLAERMVQLAAIGPSDQVLDIGTGTGVVALRVAEQIARGGMVCGIDLSQPMLETAAAKAKILGIDSKIEFRQMDAEKLEFADETFDKVVSQFALLHFPDPLAALKEIYRVTKPGGRIVVSVGSSPPLLSFAGMKHHVRIFPDIIRRFQGRQLVAPGFLDSMVERRLAALSEPEESHLAGHSHNRTQGISSLVRSAGFSVLQTDWQGHQAMFDRPEEFWDIQRTFSSIARKRLNETTDEKAEELKQDFIEQCRSVQTKGGTLVYPFAAFYVVARKPNRA